MRGIGHDLTRALTVALDCGLTLSDQQGVRHIVATMQEPHKALLLRYIPAERELIMLPDPTRALSIISQLLEDIYDQFSSIKSEMPS